MYPKEGSYLNLEKNKCYLDENHTHFLFVDDGTEGNWGVEIAFRNRLDISVRGVNHSLEISGNPYKTSEISYA